MTEGVRDEGECHHGTGGLVVANCLGTCCGTAGPSAVMLFVAEGAPLILIK